MKKSSRVVIVGAGFGGLQTAQSLANTATEVILIDRHNYHTFIPFLYQVATAQLAPEQVVIPIRNLLRRGKKNLHFLPEEVERVDFVRKEVKTNDRTIPYDFLVLATGSRSQFFGVAGAKECAFELKTLTHAVKLRNHLLKCFELAVRETNYEKKQQLLTIAIVGGGATGVELAGALVELVHSLAKDYQSLDPRDVTLILLQSGDRLLQEFPADLGKYTLKKLRRLGIKVMLNSQVAAVCPQGFELEDRTFFPSSTVIWAIGVEGAIPDSFPFPQTGDKNKIVVSPTLQLEKHPQVFAIGDLARVTSGGKALSGVAPEALQQGVYVASAIEKQLRGEQLKPFRYFNKGRLAIIGCYSGVGQIGIFKLKGFLPWLFWLAVHLVYFPDWRDRFLTLFTWLHNYVLRDRSVRLIFEPVMDEKVRVGNRNN